MAQTQTGLQDRDYEPPALVVLGDLTELTRGASGSGFDIDDMANCTSPGQQSAADCGIIP